MRLVAVFVLLASLCFAQEPFQLDGRKTVTIESPFVAWGVGPADGYQIFDWDRSRDVTLSPQAPGRAEVSAPKGKHWISLLAYKISIVNGEIDVATKEFFSEFHVGVSAPPPTNPGDPPPTDPPPVDPPPSQDFAAIRDLSRDLAGKLGDPSTQSILLTGIDGFLQFANPDDSLGNLQVSGSSAIRQSLLIAMSQGGKKNWLEGWRRGIDAAMVKVVKTSADYIGALQAAADGLRGSSSASSGVRRITMWSLPNGGCLHCERWKREMLPRFERAGFTVKIMEGGDTDVPHFLVEYDGFKAEISEYLTAELFNKTIREARGR